MQYLNTFLLLGCILAQVESTWFPINDAAAGDNVAVTAEGDDPIIWNEPNAQSSSSSWGNPPTSWYDPCEEEPVRVRRRRARALGDKERHIRGGDNNKFSSKRARISLIEELVDESGLGKEGIQRRLGDPRKLSKDDPVSLSICGICISPDSPAI